MVKILGLFLVLVGLGVFVSNEFIAGAKGEDDFMRKAAQSSMAEVALSNLALQKSQSEAVRSFAQMMVADHTAANQELMTLARSKNITLPTEMDGKHRSAMNKMQNMSGAEFDRAYMRQMVKDHEASVKLFQKQSGERGDDADVTAFASRMLPSLQSHLQMARSISNGGGGNTNMNSGNMNSNMNMNGNSNMNMNGNMNRNNNGNRNMNSNMNMNSNGNMNSNMNMNSNRNNGNSNRNTNNNRNMNSNMNSNGNMNSNMNMNSNRR